MTNLTQQYLKDCVHRLETHPFFFNLSQEDISNLVNQFTLQSFKAGDVIVNENEPIDSIYFIAEGKAEVTRSFSQMFATSVTLLQKNDFIGLGEAGLYSPVYKRSATVTAITDMLVFRLSLMDFNAAVLNNPRLSGSAHNKIKFLMRLNFLENMFPLSNMTVDEKLELAAKIEEHRLPVETVIIRQYEPGTRCYFLYSGEVEVFRTQPNGTHVHLATLTAPAIFGESAILTESPRNASVRTLENCVLYTLDRQSFSHMVEEHPHIEEALNKLMQERERENKDTLSNPKAIYVTKDGWLNYK